MEPSKNLPASLEPGQMIKFWCVSDTHSFTDNLVLEPGDVLIHCGDFTVRGTREETEKFAEWLRI